MCAVTAASHDLHCSLHRMHLAAQDKMHSWRDTQELHYKHTYKMPNNIMQRQPRSYADWEAVRQWALDVFLLLLGLRCLWARESNLWIKTSFSAWKMISTSFTKAHGLPALLWGKWTMDQERFLGKSFATSNRKRKVVSRWSRPLALPQAPVRQLFFCLLLVGRSGLSCVAANPVESLKLLPTLHGILAVP